MGPEADFASIGLADPEIGKEKTLNIEITGRHVELSDKVRGYAAEKASRLERYNDRIQRVEVVVQAEPEDRHKVELVISIAGGAALVSQSNEPSVFAAIDLVVDKAERQLKKHKEKLKDHRVKKTGEVIEEGGDFGED